MKPKKLIRQLITKKLKEGEWESITDQVELNQLYALKIKEELIEVQESGHKDIMEFIDLMQVAFSFAIQNGFTDEQIHTALTEKSVNKGTFGRLALNNLNPNNPSNKLYFDQIQRKIDIKIDASQKQISEIKTLSGWKKSKINLDKYLTEPCEIDEELYHYVGEATAPSYIDKGLIQMGEAEYSEEADDSLDHIMYYMTVSIVNKKYFYLGILPEFKQ